MDNLPAPLVGVECDLTDFKFMPLYIARLKQSKAWAFARRNPALGFYMINLWTHSWHGDPAGSLEDDDMTLMDAAECEARAWPKLREQIMRGWIKCSDNRLYHPVVAEIVAESWAEKLAHRQRTEAARKAKKEKEEAKRLAKQNGGGPPDGGATEALVSTVTETVTNVVTIRATDTVTENVAEMPQHPRDRDRDRDRDKKEEGRTELRSDAGASSDARDDLWRAGLASLVGLSGLPPGKARPLLGRLVRDAGDDCAGVHAAIRQAEEMRPIDPVPWLVEAVKARSGRRESSMDRIRRDWDLPTLDDLDASVSSGRLLQ